MKKAGLVTAMLMFVSILMFSETPLTVVKYFDGTYCFIDTTGKEVITGPYISARNFSEGLAFVELRKEYAFINENGEIVIRLPKNGEEMQFSEVQDFHEGYAAVTVNSYSQSLEGPAFIDRKGTLCFSFLAKYGAGLHSMVSAEGFSEGYALIFGDGKYGYINTKGEWLTKLMYEKAGLFHNGRARVQFPNTDKWGYIDQTGKVVIRPSYSMAFDFSEGFALVYLEDDHKSLRFININGEVIIDFYGDYMQTLSSDNQDRYIILQNISDRNSFHNGLASFMLSKGPQENNRVVYIDTTGQPVIKLSPTTSIETGVRNIYFTGSTMNCGRAIVATIWDAYGIIDDTGKFIVEPQNNWQGNKGFTNGLAKVYYQNTTAYINIDGEIVYKE